MVKNQKMYAFISVIALELEERWPIIAKFRISILKFDGVVWFSTNIFNKKEGLR